MKKIIAVCLSTLNLAYAQINLEGAKARDDAAIACNEKRFNDAAKLLKISCDKNIAQGCMPLSISYGDGRGAPRYLQTAKRYYAKACDMGDTRGCDLYNEAK